MMATLVSSLPFWQGGRDPYTGVEPAIAFPGWRAIRLKADRLAKVDPSFLRNGILAREEMLADPKLPDEKRAWYDMEREVYLQALTAAARQVRLVAA